MKHEIVLTSYKTNLLVKFDNNTFTVMMSPELGLVPVGVDPKTLERFLAIWKRTEFIGINTNIKNIDVRMSINRKKQLTDMYYKVTYNTKKEGTLTLHLYDINKVKELTVPSSVTKNAKKLNFKLN